MSEETAQRLLSELPRIARDESFAFACHPGISCFNACCSDLDLLLSPYDLLRLRRGLGLSSRELLEQHTRMERAPDNGFPLPYLRMRDDARQSCPFVRDSGCSIYDNRPGPCRYYPIGRGAGLDENDELIEELVLIREGHCHGFEEDKRWTVDTWTTDQGLEPYNRLNDRTMRLMCAWGDHGSLDESQFGMVVLALLRIDDFGEFLRDKQWFTRLDLPAGEREAILDNEEVRLLFAHDWLEAALLGKNEIRGIPLDR